MTMGKPWILALATALLLTACGGSTPAPASAPAGGTPATPAPAPAGGTPATPAPKKTYSIKIAAAVTPPNAVHIPVYVARDKGFFAEEGITSVEISSLEGGVGTARALASGAVQVALTSADPIIAAAAQGGGLKAIYSYAPRVSTAMVARPNVKTTADLKGAKIGIQEKNGFADVVSRLVLAKAGVKESDVQFVSTSTAGRLPALLEGQTDTAILHVDQVISAQAKNPNLNMLAKVWESDPNWWYACYAVSDQTIKNDPGMVEAFVRAMVKTDRWMYTHKDEVVAIMAKYNTGFDATIFGRAYDTLVAGRQWPVNEGISKEIVEYTAAKEKEIGVLQVAKAPSFDQLVDLSFAQKVVKELGKQGDGL